MELDPDTFLMCLYVVVDQFLVAATPEGVITGCGFGPADAKAQPLAETFFAVRYLDHPRLPRAGRPSGEP